MTVDEVKKIIEKEKIVAILRDIPLNSMEKVLNILKEERIRIIEITLNSNNVKKQFQIINQKYCDDFLIGAGTVTNIERMNFAIENEVKFILTPNLDEKVLKKAEEKNILCVCGFFTASEAVKAMQYKCCKILKLFPAGEVSKSYLKNLKGPIDNLNCMAVGGVNKENLQEFFQAGYSSVGLGSSLISNKLILEGKFEEIRKNVKEVKAILEKVN